jgi:hypothetical protein
MSTALVTTDLSVTVPEESTIAAVEFSQTGESAGHSDEALAGRPELTRDRRKSGF